MSISSRTAYTDKFGGNRESLLRLLGKCVVVIAVAYASVYCVGPYGFNDDYQYLHRTYLGIFDPAHNEQAGMGRPAAAWMLDIGFTLCDGLVGNLVFLRLVSIAGTILFALVLNRGLLRAGYAPGFALSVALLVALSPAFGVYAAWAAAFPSPCALVLCLLAGQLLEGSNEHGSLPWLRCVGAFLLVVLGCSIWQAAAPISLFIGFSSAWRRPDAFSAAGRGARTHRHWLAWTILGLSAFSYLLIHALAVRSGWISVAGTERMTLATNVSRKVWLLGDLLRSGLTSWARLHSIGWEYLVGGLTLGGCLLSVLVRRDDGKLDPPAIAHRVVLALIMILASISPLLVAGENNAAYRTLPVLYLTLVFVALEGYCHRLRNVSPRARSLLGHALVISVAICAGCHVRNGIVEPNVREYTGVRAQVRQQFQRTPEKVVYLVPPPILLSGEWLKPSWEYGLVSSSFWWVTKPFLLRIFDDLKLPAARQPNSLDISYREAGNKDVPVIHPMPALLREPGHWHDDPRWGHVQVFSGGWLYSPWFGYLNVRDFPVLQHHILGPLLFIGHGADNLWFHREGLGEFHTSQVAFPSLYLGNTKEWVYLTDADGAHCALRDSKGVTRLLPDPMGR